ncbi:unnamed protein product [Symbiodinium natans]|uniref:Uncharacterized protein n=1 Tax=Symbiodinium natans TaxID=878477 RepID=A0A812RY56_9DINO|nr:unnamed protein product [Symbiodinium natans]
MSSQIMLGVGTAVVLAHIHWLGGHTWAAWTGLVKKGHHAMKEGHFKEEPFQQSHISERLTRSRISNYRLATSISVHMSMLTFLARLGKFVMDPGFEDAVVMIAISVGYALDACVCSGQILLTRERLLRISVVLCTVMHCMNLSYATTTIPADHMLAYSLLTTANTLAGLVCLRATIWVPSAIALALCDATFFAQKFGLEELSSNFVLDHTVRLVLNCAILIGAEMSVRGRLQSEVECEDASSMVRAFQQILKGLCDGSLILDNRMMIRGSPVGLQRLLPSRTISAGDEFCSLMGSEEMKDRFLEFIAGSVAASSAGRSSQVPQGGPPACWRVVLSDGGRELHVDVFHATLPRLFGAEEPYHLLALVEDPEERELWDAALLSNSLQPSYNPSGTASHQSSEVMSIGPASSRRSECPSACPSAASRSNEVLEALSELVEATFLVDPASENMDLLEVHLNFNRHSPARPSLKMLALIQEWEQLQLDLRTYTLDLLRGAPDIPASLRAMKLRIPGAPRKVFKANYARLSRASQIPGQPTYLYLHLKDFNKQEAQPNHPRNWHHQTLEEEADDRPAEACALPLPGGVCIHGPIYHF